MVISRQFTHQYLTTVFNVKHRGVFYKLWVKRKNRSSYQRPVHRWCSWCRTRVRQERCRPGCGGQKRRTPTSLADAPTPRLWSECGSLRIWRGGEKVEEKKERKRERQDLTYGSQRVCGDKSHRRSCWLTPKWCAAEQIIYLLGMHTHDKRQTNLARLMSNVLCCVWVSDLHPTYLFIISFNPAVCMQFGRKRILVEQLGNNTHGTLIN